MALALTRENYVLHKLHSLTGIVPVGYYMVQHLTLNSFALLGGKDKFDGIIHFFEGIPKPFLLAFEALGIWLPLLFHAVYGLFIANRGQNNYFSKKYGWSENRMYMLQRWSGIFIFAFLLYHVISTTGAKYLTNDASIIMFDAWKAKLTGSYFLILVVYMLGVLTSSYHLAYGIWNFCIRWGITISESAQVKIQKVSAFVFVALTLLGWGALAGFIINPGSKTADAPQPAAIQQSL